MITIYSINGTEYQIIGRDNEDGNEGGLAIQLMQWYASGLLWLLVSPIQLAVFLLLILWPVISYG